MRLKYFLILFSTVLSALAVQAGKPKDATLAMSLEEWAKVQKASKPSEIEGVKMYRPDYDGEKLSISDMLEPTQKGDRIFENSLLWISANKEAGTHELQSLDTDKRRFVVSLHKYGKEGSVNSFDFDIAFQVADGLVSFYAYDLKANYKFKGLVPKTSRLEKLNHQEKENDANLLEECAWVISNYLKNIEEAIQANEAEPVSHWEEIKEQEVVKGMNTTEVILAAGKPFSEREGGNGKMKWMFDNNTVVIFSEGKVINVIK